MDIIKTLQELCSLSAPSGYERPAAEKAAELMKPFTDEAYIDHMGNAVGVLRCGKKNAKKLLLCAHLDEVSMTVTSIEDGFLHFIASGVDRRMLPDREVRILSDPPLIGVVAVKPPHVLSREEMSQSLPVDKLVIDTGLSQKEAEKRIPIGTPMTYRPDCFSMGDLFVSKTTDDRACFVSFLRALELLKGSEFGMDVYLLGSVNEERGGLGASTGTFALDPDVIFVADVTFARQPDVGPDVTVELRKGPAIGVGPNCSRPVNEHLFALAGAQGIPYQLEILPGNSGTDGWEMQIAREGYPTALLSLPQRYMHTPFEAVAPADIEVLAALTAAFAKEPPKEVFPC